MQDLLNEYSFLYRQGSSDMGPDGKTTMKEWLEVRYFIKIFYFFIFYIAFVCLYLYIFYYYFLGYDDKNAQINRR